MIKDVNSIYGLAKIVSVFGAGVQEVEKELQGVLPENLIVFTGTNNIVKHLNRFEELMNKIKKLLNDLKEKCDVFSYQALFLDHEWVEDGIIYYFQLTCE